VKALLPILVQKLAEINPGNSELYKKNADKFANELVKLDEEITLKISGIKDKPIFLFHPSFLYMINRYGLTYGGSMSGIQARKILLIICFVIAKSNLRSKSNLF